MTLWTVGCQAPLLFPPPGALPHPGIETASPASAGGFFTTESPWKPCVTNSDLREGIRPQLTSWFSSWNPSLCSSLCSSHQPGSSPGLCLPSPSPQGPLHLPSTSSLGSTQSGPSYFCTEAPPPSTQTASGELGTLWEVLFLTSQREGRVPSWGAGQD